jgi:hypothetical protein
VLDLSEIDHHSLDLFINGVDPFLRYSSDAVSCSLEVRDIFSVAKSLNLKLHNVHTSPYKKHTLKLVHKCFPKHYIFSSYCSRSS